MRAKSLRHLDPGTVLEQGPGAKVSKIHAGVRRSKQTPDHGRSRRDFSVSGSRAKILSSSGRRFSAAAFLRNERTSETAQPNCSKNLGPSAGAKRNGAVSRSCELMRLLSMRSNPGDAISTIQKRNVETAARSFASSATASDVR